MTSDTSAQGFLGEEFLTWLWFHLDTEGGEFDLGDGIVAGVSLDDFILFAPIEGDETEQTLRKGTPTLSPEASAALENGHRLRRARLVIAVGEQTWRLTLDGPTMNLLSIRLPDDDEEASSAEERSRERAANFLMIHDVVRRLYRAFLRVRLRPDYLSTDGERQAQWMTAR